MICWTFFNRQFAIRVVGVWPRPRTLHSNSTSNSPVVSPNNNLIPCIEPSPALNFLCLTWCRFIRSLVAFTVVIIARELAVGVNDITSAQKSRLAFTDGSTCEWMGLVVVKLCRWPCECFNGHYQSLPRPLRQAKPQSSAYHCQTSFAHGGYWVQRLTWVNTKNNDTLCGTIGLSSKCYFSLSFN